jgi:hypothetical protein
VSRGEYRFFVMIPSASSLPEIRSVHSVIIRGIVYSDNLTADRLYLASYNRRKSILYPAIVNFIAGDDHSCLRLSDFPDLDNLSGLRISG